MKLSSRKIPVVMPIVIGDACSSSNGYGTFKRLREKGLATIRKNNATVKMNSEVLLVHQV
jgi:hypothetical protein